MTDNEEKQDKGRSVGLTILGVFWLIFGLFLLANQLFAKPEIEVTWQTESEYQTAGFNIYRSEDRIGTFEKVNERLIPSSPDAAAGGDYIFLDTDIQRGRTYFYQLEDVEYDNSTIRHNPITVIAPPMSWIIFALAGISFAVGPVIIAVSYWRNRHA